MLDYATNARIAPLSSDLAKLLRDRIVFDNGPLSFYGTRCAARNALYVV